MMKLALTAFGAALLMAAGFLAAVAIMSEYAGECATDVSCVKIGFMAAVAAGAAIAAGVKSIQCGAR